MPWSWNITFLVFVTFGGLTSASIGRFLPFSGFYPIPRQTPEPINIVTGLTYPLSTLRPLKFEGNNIPEETYITNTGAALEVTLKKNYTTFTVTGGPLGSNIYTYIKTAFHWSNNTNNGVAYTTVDGKQGSALEVLVIFYNHKYRSFNESTKYRDGVAKITFRIYISSKPNPAFDPFAAAVKKVQKPGPVAPLKLRDSFLWFYNFPFDTGYFAYPGSLGRESTTGGTFYCATTIPVDRHVTQYISKKQFKDTFLKLENANGGSLTNVIPQKPRGFRPVARGRGIIKKISNKIYRSSVNG